MVGVVRVGVGVGWECGCDFGWCVWGVGKVVFVVVECDWVVELVVWFGCVGSGYGWGGDWFF